MPKRAVPGWLALGFGGGDGMGRRLVTERTPAATREGVRLALRSGPFDSRKARSELGYAPRPLQDALTRCGDVAVVGGRGREVRPPLRLAALVDFADELAEVVHPEAVAEQLAASAQRAEAFGGVARQARHARAAASGAATGS